MKKLLAVLIIIFPSMIFAQLKGASYITPYAGLSVPFDKSTYNTSFNTGVNFEISLSNITSIGFDVNIANFTSDEVRAGMITNRVSPRSYSAGNYRTTGLMPFIKFQSAEAINKVQLFVRLGAGVSFLARTGSRTTYYDNSVVYSQSVVSSGILLAPSIGTYFAASTANKIVIEAQYRLNKSSTDEVNAFLLNIGYAFRM
ncbi:MAG: hypothetical protein JSS63_15125 [Bacteroidetes bacterium]|nr:hypothetical protein [Bacteroidota bacterium]